MYILLSLHRVCVLSPFLRPLCTSTHCPYGPPFRLFSGDPLIGPLDDLWFKGFATAFFTLKAIQWFVSILEGAFCNFWSGSSSSTSFVCFSLLVTSFATSLLYFSKSKFSSLNGLVSLRLGGKRMMSFPNNLSAFAFAISSNVFLSFCVKWIDLPLDLLRLLVCDDWVLLITLWQVLCNPDEHLDLDPERDLLYLKLDLDLDLYLIGDRQDIWCLDLR